MGWAAPQSSNLKYSTTSRRCLWCERMVLFDQIAEKVRFLLCFYVLSNQCSVIGLNDNNCPSIIFSFNYFFYCFCATCNFYCKKVVKREQKKQKKTSNHSQDCPAKRISWRRSSPNPVPPSFSKRRKFNGLCGLLWRYCLWWLPLAVLFNYYFLGCCLDSPCSAAWRVTVATVNCVWCVVIFLLK